MEREKDEDLDFRTRTVKEKEKGTATLVDCLDTCRVTVQMDNDLWT